MRFTWHVILLWGPCRCVSLRSVVECELSCSGATCVCGLLSFYHLNTSLIPLARSRAAAGRIVSQLIVRTHHKYMYMYMLCCTLSVLFYN